MSAGSKADIAPIANEVGSCPSNGHQLRKQRERHADIEAEKRHKGHSDDLEVLQRKDDRRRRDQNDDSEVSSSSIKRPPGEQTANYTSTTAVQAEAESDRACPGHDEIDAKEHAEDIEA